MDKPAGETYSLAELEAALKQHKPQGLFLCQGESSAGTHQQIEGVGKLCAAVRFPPQTLEWLGEPCLSVATDGMNVIWSGERAAHCGHRVHTGRCAVQG
jgi:hypothetical protein